MNRSHSLEGKLREGSPAPAFPHPSGSGQAPGEAGGGGGLSRQPLGGQTDPIMGDKL